MGVEQRNGRYAYDDRPRGVSEAEPLDFHSPYGCSKGAGDQYVRDYARIYGLRTVVFRQSCIYGTRQFGIEDQGWVAWFCVAAVTGQAVHDLRRRQADPRHPLGRRPVRRLRAAVERIERASGQVFNLGGGPANTLSLLELVAHLDRLTAGRSGRPSPTGGPATSGSSSPTSRAPRRRWGGAPGPA